MKNDGTSAELSQLKSWIAEIVQLSNLHQLFSNSAKSLCFAVVQLKQLDFGISTISTFTQAMLWTGNIVVLVGRSLCILVLHSWIKVGRNPYRLLMPIYKSWMSSAARSHLSRQIPCRCRLPTKRLFARVAVLISVMRDWCQFDHLAQNDAAMGAESD